MKRNVLLSIAIAATATIALGAKITAPLAVSAKVQGNCVVTGGSLNFGVYDPLAASDLNGTGTFTIACTKGAIATIDLDNGLNSSGGWRQMLGGGDLLKYALYKDAARTQVWGTALTGGTAATYAAPSKTAATLTVYGLIPQAQDVIIADPYSDSVTITVNY